MVMQRKCKFLSHSPQYFMVYFNHSRSLDVFNDFPEFVFRDQIEVDFFGDGRIIRYQIFT